jgi:hypothetical protein
VWHKPEDDIYDLMGTAPHSCAMENNKMVVMQITISPYV